MTGDLTEVHVIHLKKKQLQNYNYTENIRNIPYIMYTYSVNALLLLLI